MAFWVNNKRQMRPFSLKTIREPVGIQSPLIECYVDHDAAQRNLQVYKRLVAQRSKHQLADHLAHGGHIVSVSNTATSREPAQTVYSCGCGLSQML